MLLISGLCYRLSNVTPAIKENLKRVQDLRYSWESFIEKSSKENAVPGAELMKCHLFHRTGNDTFHNRMQHILHLLSSTSFLILLMKRMRLIKNKACKKVDGLNAIHFFFCKLSISKYTVKSFAVFML